jgi:hypothetical protein
MRRSSSGMSQHQQNTCRCALSLMQGGHGCLQGAYCVGCVRLDELGELARQMLGVGVEGRKMVDGG